MTERRKIIPFRTGLMKDQALRRTPGFVPESKQSTCIRDKDSICWGQIDGVFTVLLSAIMATNTQRQFIVSNSNQQYLSHPSGVVVWPTNRMFSEGCFSFMWWIDASEKDWGA